MFIRNPAGTVQALYSLSSDGRCMNIIIFNISFKRRNIYKKWYCRSRCMSEQFFSISNCGGNNKTAGITRLLLYMLLRFRVNALLVFVLGWVSNTYIATEIFLKVTIFVCKNRTYIRDTIRSALEYSNKYDDSVLLSDFGHGSQWPPAFFSRVWLMPANYTGDITVYKCVRINRFGANSNPRLYVQQSHSPTVRPTRQFHCI